MAGTTVGSVRHSTGGQRIIGIAELGHALCGGWEGRGYDEPALSRIPVLRRTMQHDVSEAQ